MTLAFKILLRTKSFYAVSRALAFQFSRNLYAIRLPSLTQF